MVYVVICARIMRRDKCDILAFCVCVSVLLAAGPVCKLIAPSLLTMDSLAADQRKALRTASTERLRVWAAGVEGVDEEDILTMDRPALTPLRLDGPEYVS